MPENKTKATNVSVKAYIDGLTDPIRRVDAKELVELMQTSFRRKTQTLGTIHCWLRQLSLQI